MHSLTRRAFLALGAIGGLSLIAACASSPAAPSPAAPAAPTSPPPTSPPALATATPLLPTSIAAPASPTTTPATSTSIPATPTAAPPSPTPTVTLKTTGPQLGWWDDFAANGKPNVATTVAPLSSIARNVGGDRINLHGIIPDGTDSHTFEPAPGDAKVLAQADMIVVNGLHLETPTEKLAQANLKPGAKIYVLGDNTITQKDWIFDFTFPKEKGDPNPHLWMNPQYAMHYAELLRDWLTERDPTNKDYYATNAKLYLDKLGKLDQGIEAAINSIPAQNRKLLTYHDSFAYFGRRYGIVPIGAVQPSDFSEPTAKEVAALIEQVKKEHVPAIFGSEVFPSKVLEQIAKESGAQYIDKLRDDEPPGIPQSPMHTYVGLMLDDMDNMVPALGGTVDSLKGIDPADGFVRSS